MTKPIAYDLFCGLGGWTEGLLAEGYDVTGFDIEAHEYGEERYPAKLVLQDVLTIDGARLAGAALIVASPPCQEFSYMAMPWKRAKQIARALRGQDEFPEPYSGSRTIGELTALFDACFRIKREASEAAGRDIPLVVENVRGAEPWVGRARWSFGSYYLWGDVPALMPHTLRAHKFNPDGTNHGQGSWFAVADSKNRGTKNTGGSWFKIGSPDQKVTGENPDGRHWKRDPVASCSSGSRKRAHASAKIAKIPFALSSWIARAVQADGARSMKAHAQHGLKAVDANKFSTGEG